MADTIYSTLLTFFYDNPEISYTRKEIYKKFKNVKVSTLHTTLGSLAREKHIVPINPKKWQYNKVRHESFV